MYDAIFFDLFFIFLIIFKIFYKKYTKNNSNFIFEKHLNLKII